MKPLGSWWTKLIHKTWNESRRHHEGRRYSEEYYEKRRRHALLMAEAKKLEAEMMAERMKKVRILNEVYRK